MILSYTIHVFIIRLKKYPLFYWGNLSCDIVTAILCISYLEFYLWVLTILNLFINGEFEGEFRFSNLGKFVNFGFMTMILTYLLSSEMFLRKTRINFFQNETFCTL